MEIKASDVKALREKTGAGMMECKKALAETNGDAAAAEKLLKEKGLAAVEKRADRATSEGRIFIKIDGNKAVICELTCETDFVAKNTDFIQIGNDIAATALAKGYTTVNQELSDMLLDLATKIRENMNLRRLEVVDVPAGAVVSSYVHSDGKTGVITVISTEPESATDNPVVKEFAYDCCLHIAAFTPAYIRKEDVGTKEFREVINEIAQLMCYEATRDLKTKNVKIKTPIAETVGKELAGRKPAIVPILRAGVGMVDGMLSLIPAAKVGHIGLYRDPETLEPVEYYCKLPSDCEEREVFVVDPMLATGGSSAAAIRMLKEKGVNNIRFLCIIAAPEGVERMQKEHPDVDLYIGALDEKLNEHGYIVPGLGDAGDRIFGTK